MKLLLTLLLTLSTLFLFTQPVNDDCGSATSLDVSIGACSYTIGDNTDAGSSDLDPTPSCANFQGEDIWFSFLAPAEGVVSIETIETGSMDDTGMAIYSGSCGDLTEIACDDDTGIGFFSLIELEDLIADETYYIRIWSFNAQTSGEFGICVVVPGDIAPPTNDYCGDAELVEVGGPLECEPTIFSNIGATSDTLAPDPTCASYNGADIWLKVVVPPSGEIILETAEDISLIDTGMAIYSGDCDDLTEIACDDDSGEGLYSMIELVELTAGDTLFVRIWEFDGGFENSFVFCAYEPSLCGDISTLFSDSVALDHIQVNWATGNSGATYILEYGPPGFDLGTGTIHTGTVGMDSPPVGIDGLDEGTAYDIYVSETCEGDMPSNTLNGTFFTAFPIPINDLCSEAITIEVGGAEECVPTLFSNGGATDSGLLPAPGCANYQGGDVWFELTVPPGGVVFVETFEGLGLNDLGMAAYSGGCDEAVLLACDDDSGEDLFSLLELTGLAAGETIHIRIWDYNGNDQGNFELCAYQPPLCSPLEDLDAVLITEDSISVSWSSVNANASFTLEYGPAGFTPGSGTVVTGASGVDGPPVGIGGLDPSATFDFYLQELCEDDNLTESLTATFTTLGPPPTNDDLCDAIAIIVGDPEVSMSTNGATGEPDEPVGSCWFFASTEINSVWASFVAPATGGAIVSTDYLDNVLSDTHIAIYSTEGDCNDMVSLTEVGCDEDGGVLGIPSYASIATLTGLVPGQTYYIQIDGYNSTMGQFFISVSPLPVSIREWKRVPIDVYPNPTSHTIHVDISSLSAAFDVQLIDLKGKIVQEWRVNETDSEQISLDLSLVETGLYLLHLRSEDAHAIERIVLE